MSFQEEEIGVAEAVSLDCPLTVVPIFNAKRNAMAMRVQAGASADGGAPSLSALYSYFEQALPNDAIPVLLSVPSQCIDEGILAHKARGPLWIELGAEYVASDEGRSIASKLAAAHHKLVLLGPPTEAFKPAQLSAFSLSLLTSEQDQAVLAQKAASGPFGGKNTQYLRRVPFGQVGLRSVAQIEETFHRGTVAVLGWPFEDLGKQAAHSNAIPDFSTISELIMKIDRGADVSELEDIIRRDAALSFRLLRLVNSAAMGLQVQIESFRHVVLMLGYMKLKRWLALMLANASRDLNSRPVMFVSFRRALFLEALMGGDRAERQTDEAFLLGVFSMLDKLFGEPFAKLFESLKVPPEVYAALAQRAGPFLPLLQLIEALDQGVPGDVQRALDAAQITPEQCNEALRKTLSTPDVSRGLQ